MANSHAAAAGAYGRIHTRGIGGRRVEAEAFARAASYLRQAQDRPGDRSGLARALGFNQKLWTIVQAEASDPNHPAPIDMRDGMLDLARFMDQATADSLHASAPRLDAMIAVNESLASGLFGRAS